MTLEDALDRCRDFETRSAALYWGFAADAHDQPDVCALWTGMACEEDDHARLLSETRDHLPTSEGWVTKLSGRWSKVVTDVDTKLSQAERLPRGAGVDQQLAAAFELEMTEIEPLHQMLVAVSRRRSPRPIAESHALRLVDAAERLSNHPHVRQLAALLRARVSPQA